MASEVQAPIGAPAFDYKADWRKAEKDYISKLAALAQRTNGHAWTTVVGEVLRWQRGDGYAQYMVWSERPLQIMHLAMGDAWSIEPETIRGLRLADVKAMVESEASLNELFGHRDEFYDTLLIGDIVHYNSSFAEWIRCEVMMGTDVDHFDGSETPNVKVLRPVALVGPIGRRQLPDGKWEHGFAEWDLVTRDPDGTVRYGYQAEKIIKGETFKPNALNLYEHPDFNRKGGPDPRPMAPISLDPPPMTDEDRAIQPLAMAVKRIRSRLEDVSYTYDDLRELLRDVINDAGTGL